MQAAESQRLTPNLAVPLGMLFIPSVPVVASFPGQAAA